MSGVEPILVGCTSTSTGRKLVAWMKANGEDYAKEELELADEEEGPKEIFTCDIAKLVEDAEMRHQMGILKMVRGSDRKEQRKGEEFFRPVGIFLLHSLHLV